MGFVGALNDPLRGPTFHIASGCTTAAAPCASSSIPPSCVSRSSPSRWVCARKSPALSSSPRRSRTNVAASGAPSRSSRKSFLLGWDFARAGATATRVAEFMFDEGLAQGERPRDIRAWIEGSSINRDIGQRTCAWPALVVVRNLMAASTSGKVRLLNRWNGSRLLRTPHAGVDASYSCVQTYSGHWDAILPRIGLDERCWPIAPNRST